MKLNEHLQIPKIKVVYYHYIAYICLTFATFTVAGTIHNVAASDFLSAAIVRSYGGDGLLIREGTTRKPFQEALDGSLIGELRRFRDVLEIQGDNRSGARLSFTTESSVVVDYGGLSIQTRPGRRAVEYRFPCGSARGNLTIGWRYAGMSRDRACNDGINVGPRKNWFSKHPDTDYISILSSLKSLTVAQVEDDGVLVAPNGSGQLLVDVTDNNDRVEIVAIIGDARITSAQFPTGQILSQGQQYTYFGNGTGTISNVNLDPIMNSRHIQDFLDPNSWSSLPTRVGDSVISQINEYSATEELTSDLTLLDPNQGHSTESLYARMEAYMAIGNWRYADLQHIRLLEQIGGPGSSGNDGYPPLRTDVIDRLPCNDLLRIDNLWQTYSENHFGYSAQNRAIRNLGISPQILRQQTDQGNWITYDDLAYNLGWKRSRERISDAYYSFHELNFSLNAPQGHLPAGWGYVTNVRLPPEMFDRTDQCGL